MSKSRSPFAGWPRTRRIDDAKGNIAFAITPRVLTPVRARLADGLAVLICLAGIGGAVWFVDSLESAEPWYWFAAVIGPALAWGVVRLALRWCFRRRVRIRMTIDQFCIRRLWGWKRYDRDLPHRYSLIVHDRAEEEADSLQTDMMNARLEGKKLRPQTRYYGESWHLSYDYIGQRNDILTVFGRKDATLLLGRLKAVDDVLDSLARQGRGTPLSPDDEWGELPGTVPETRKA